MKVFAVILGVLLLMTLAGAENYVVSNSADGRDLISAISYANVVDEEVYFLSPGGSGAAAKIGSGKDILLVQSEDNAFTLKLRSDLENNGNDVEMLASADPLETNLVLAERSGTKKFVLVDTTYGYNFLSVIPYAAVTDSYILMADESNAADVASFLNGAAPTSVIQYGYLDEAVTNSVGSIITKTINTGSKYLDNLEIVEMYLDEVGGSQAVLADGTFIENTLATGEDPIILVSNLIPDEVYDFILEGDLNTLVLVGNDLVPAVDSMREALINDGKDISVFVKFGKATPGIDTGVQQLDTFPLPAVPLGLEIKSVTYNDAEKVLEVTYSNTVDAVAYVMADITLKADGQNLKTLGDDEPLMVAKGAEMGKQYPFDMDEITLNEEAELIARVLASYGATPTSMEKVVAGDFPVGTISVTDDSEMDAVKLHYDMGTKQLSLTVKNTGSVDAYYIPSFDLETDDGIKEYSREDVMSLGAGKSKDIIFAGVELSGEEVAMNSEVPVHIDYGSREAFLTKSVDKNLALEATGSAGGDYSILIILLIVIVCLFAVLILRKKNKKRR